VVFDEGFGFGFVDFSLDREGFYHLGVDAGLEDAVFVIDVGGAAGHSCAEVLAGGAEDDDEAVGQRVKGKGVNPQRVKGSIREL